MGERQRQHLGCHIPRHAFSIGGIQCVRCHGPVSRKGGDTSKVSVLAVSRLHVGLEQAAQDEQADAQRRNPPPVGAIVNALKS